MASEARAAAEDWLRSAEAEAIRQSISADICAVEVIEDYFNGWRQDPLGIGDVMRYFLIDYLEAGTADGHALRINPVSAIIRCDLGERGNRHGDRLDAAVRIRDECPSAFHWMLRLARQHANICQAVLYSSFKSHTLQLRRGVARTDVRFAIESWAFAGSVSAYGPIRLDAAVPLSSVLSLRAQEHEIVVARPSWESSIIANCQRGHTGASEEHRIPTWRDALATGLERSAARLRGRHSARPSVRRRA